MQRSFIPWYTLSHPASASTAWKYRSARDDTAFAKIRQSDHSTVVGSPTIHKCSHYWMLPFCTITCAPLLSCSVHSKYTWIHASTINRWRELKNNRKGSLILYILLYKHFSLTMISRFFVLIVHWKHLYSKYANKWQDIFKVTVHDYTRNYTGKITSIKGSECQF